MRRSRVRVGAVVIALTVVLAACSSAQGETDPPAGRAAEPGDFAGLVDVGGRNLYLECRGRGSPTVVLQSGFPNAADIWSVGAERPPSVMEGVAGFTVSAPTTGRDRPASRRPRASRRTSPRPDAATRRRCPGPPRTW